MRHFGEHFINGQWIAPEAAGERPLIDPTTEEPWATVATGGSASDVDRAVMSARHAFASFSRSSIADRIALIDRVIAAYERREADLAQLIAQEVGVPVSFRAQVRLTTPHSPPGKRLLGQTDKRRLPFIRAGL